MEFIEFKNLSKNFGPKEALKILILRLKKVKSMDYLVLMVVEKLQ